tara:strand:+ start:1046 stop:1216 length:171 start_codon:yes stop_codon:yes gene_type:complete
MKTITFPVNPYIGQIFYSPDNDKTFEFLEVTKTDESTGIVEESGVWFDITDRDLVP